MGRRFALIVLSLLAASALSVGTLVAQIHETHDHRYTFLFWNLFLAWVPLIAASSAFVLARRRAGALVGALILVWLLFFPNAPYVLTDFIHLHGDGPSPLWYDALMLSSFAWTALMLGFVSLYLVHTIIGRRAGASVCWVMVVCVLGLASFGVYLGRFARFNSWDVVTQPHLVLSVVRQEIDSPLHDPKMVAALLALTAFLLVGYLVLYAFSALRLELADPAAET
ncbi:MAG TPA: DUF1361 domain-containing protein [Gaiellaceae bacterium]|nr:DUF1361 domain-containing protein [Gaiellaceae bacterium]